ncbi:hypothetical protein HanIR_Chr02g0092181 [Helianthus annuus]|nr:hypothetical protein HanIR_Chr02g0092181 [Helianthus annuus]
MSHIKGISFMFLKQFVPSVSANCYAETVNNLQPLAKQVFFVKWLSTKQTC